MLHYALVFFILAVIAGVLGFGGVAGTLASGAKLLFAAFIILTIVFALVGRKSPPV